MQCLKLSRQQWQSEHFFSDFFALHALFLLSIENQQLTFHTSDQLKGSSIIQATNPQQTEDELIVMAKVMSFETLHHVMRALSEHLQLISMRKLPQLAEQEELALCCSVKIENSDGLSELLMTLSDETGFELAVLNKQRPKLSEPGLLLMDMDSTAIQIECIDEIAKLAGVGEQVAAVTEKTMRGELDFNESLRARVAALKGADQSILAEVANNMPLANGLESLLTVLKDNNWKIAIASGGFTYFTEHLKNRLALDATVANVLEIVDGKLTGGVVGDIVNASTKKCVLNELAKRYSIPLSQTVAIGDGANDLLMLNAAALGIACHAKPIVRQQAMAAISHHGLDSLLFFLIG